MGMLPAVLREPLATPEDPELPAAELDDPPAVMAVRLLCVLDRLPLADDGFRVLS